MHLLRDVERYLRQSGTKPSRFGREALGDPAFVAALRRGREPRAATAAKVRAHIARWQAETKGPVR